MLNSDFKKCICHPVEFKKCSCHPVESKKCSCHPVEFKKLPRPMSLFFAVSCRMSLRLKRPFCRPVDFRGLGPQKCQT